MQTLLFLFVQTHQKIIENCKKLIKQLNRQAVLKKEKTADLDLELASMEVTVAERRKLCEAIGIDTVHETST